jgi:hypothetical protein
MHLKANIFFQYLQICFTGKGVFSLDLWNSKITSVIAIGYSWILLIWLVVSLLDSPATKGLDRVQNWFLGEMFYFRILDSKDEKGIHFKVWSRIHIWEGFGLAFHLVGP